MRPPPEESAVVMRWLLAISIGALAVTLTESGPRRATVMVFGTKGEAAVASVKEGPGFYSLVTLSYEPSKGRPMHADIHLRRAAAADLEIGKPTPIRFLPWLAALPEFEDDGGTAWFQSGLGVLLTAVLGAVLWALFRVIGLSVLVPSFGYVKLTELAVGAYAVVYGLVFLGRYLFEAML